jgi:hypothetical protein
MDSKKKKVHDDEILEIQKGIKQHKKQTCAKLQEIRQTLTEDFSLDEDCVDKQS